MGINDCSVEGWMAVTGCTKWDLALSESAERIGTSFHSKSCMTVLSLSPGKVLALWWFGLFPDQGKKTVPLARGCVGSGSSDRWAGQACPYPRIVFSFCCTYAQPWPFHCTTPNPRPWSHPSSSSGHRSRTPDLINQHGFKERTALFTGACAMPHAVTCFGLSCSTCFVARLCCKPHAKFQGWSRSAEWWTPGAVPGLLSGAVCWQGPALGPFSMSFGRKTLADVKEKMGKCWLQLRSRPLDSKGESGGCFCLCFGNP